MSARVCTQCGASASDQAEVCEACGAPLEARRLHEDSDVRIEPERIDAALPIEVPAMTSGRWARVSDQPPPLLDDDADEGNKIVTAPHELPHSSPDVHAAAADRVAVLSENGSTQIAVAGIAAAGGGSDIAIAPSATTTSPQPRASLTDLTAIHPSGPPVPKRPPVLASEALLRDLAPARPARRALRFWCPLLGVLGTAIAWLLTQGQGLGWLIAGTFAALAVLGLPPMPYQGRASAVTTVSATGLVLLLWTDPTGPAGTRRVLLTASVTLLASGLLFRAWHRASGLSRSIVALGVVLASLFLWLSGGLNDLTLVDTEWQSWLPRVVALSFAMLLLLALLAFMDARSTGGATVWAILILCWNALNAAVTILHDAWPKQARAFDLGRIPTTTLLVWTSAPLLTALLAIGLAQLMAAGVADATQRRCMPGLRRHRQSLAPRSLH